MGPKQLAEFIHTMNLVKSQLELHLKEGVGVQTDLRWLKDCYKDLRALNIGLFVCALGAFLKYALGH
jgi:hypothetical protein